MNLLVLALRYWKATTITVLVVSLVVAVKVSIAEHDRRIASDAIAAQRAWQADSILHVVGLRRDSIEVRYVHDTVRVTRTLARVDTLRETVLRHLTDTLEVLRYITSVDSAQQACRDGIRTCSELRLAAEQERDAYKVRLANLPVPPRRSCFVSNVVWGVLGAGAGVVIRY